MSPSPWIWCIVSFSVRWDSPQKSSGRDGYLFNHAQVQWGYAVGGRGRKQSLIAHKPRYDQPPLNTGSPTRLLPTDSSNKKVIERPTRYLVPGVNRPDVRFAWFFLNKISVIRLFRIVTFGRSTVNGGLLKYNMKKSQLLGDLS